MKGKIPDNYCKAGASILFENGGSWVMLWKLGVLWILVWKLGVSWILNIQQTEAQSTGLRISSSNF